VQTACKEKEVNNAQNTTRLGLTEIGGSVDLRSDYKHPLPEGLTEIGELVILDSGYQHPLPAEKIW
jgi:hypothetical protein